MCLARELKRLVELTIDSIGLLELLEAKDLLEDRSLVRSLEFLYFSAQLRADFSITVQTLF